MIVTTEEAERLAKQHDLVRFTLGMKAPEHDLTAAALRSLAAERDVLQARCKEAERERAHQHGRADRSAAEYAREQAKREALQARVAELERALDFYACVDHYQIHNAAAPNVVQFDRGAKARAAAGEGK